MWVYSLRDLSQGKEKWILYPANFLSLGSHERCQLEPHPGWVAGPGHKHQESPVSLQPLDPFFLHLHESPILGPRVGIEVHS